MIRIEPVILSPPSRSALPTELHQPCKKITSVMLTRSEQVFHIARSGTAKKANRPVITALLTSKPGSMSFLPPNHRATTEQAQQPSTFAPADRGPRHPSSKIPWCTGEDSNLRSSKERQIYSLLPLTARPPVHIAGWDKVSQSDLTNSTECFSTPTHSADAFPRSQRKP